MIDIKIKSERHYKTLLKKYNWINYKKQGKSNNFNCIILLQENE